MDALSHVESEFKSAVLGDQEPGDTPRLSYTREQLMDLRPAEGGNPAGKDNVTPVVNEENVGGIQPDLAQTPPDGEWHVGTPGEEADGPVLEEKKKKKKKKKSSGKNKKAPATGFEEFYADAPITPAEYNEEQNEIYHHTRSFVERMQQCIQRYRARRKFDSQRSNIFSKYLILGGVQSGVKAFGGGLDDDTLENCNAAEIADIRAIDHIQGGVGPIKYYDPGDPINWAVDFEDVVKGFLSYKAPLLCGTAPGMIKEYCSVIRNFLNYVLMHGVCPEYTSNIMAAHKICSLAEKELLLINDVCELMPGDFNMAASTLYGGYYKELLGAWSTEWPLPEPETEEKTKEARSRDRRIRGMRIAEAERIFKTAIAFVGTLAQFESMMEGSPHVIKEEYRSMEVCEIILPTPAMRTKFAGTVDGYGEMGNVQSLGILKVKNWMNPESHDEDRSDDGNDRDDCPVSVDDTVESFWVEEEILEKCFLGMRFTATVHELNNGILYFDSIMSVYCSFFTYLNTQRLEGWKEPVDNPRPAKTVDDRLDDDEASEDFGDDFD